MKTRSFWNTRKSVSAKLPRNGQLKFVEIGGTVKTFAFLVKAGWLPVEAWHAEIIRRSASEIPFREK